MKILLFNLGSIEHRIIAWDIEGYKPIFDQEVVLWGPIPDEKFNFNGKEIPIIRFFEETSIKTIFNRLPNGWVPDIVACDTSSLIYVPDIHLCPVKTILFTRDAWADTIFNRDLVENFDFISHSIIDISSYDKYQINVLPIAGFPVSLPSFETPHQAFRKRRIDVIAIANYDDAFYHDRYRVLYKLAVSNKGDLNIKYFKGLKRNEIHEYYRRSKIVIDWAHTLSNRSYEAALNGCLLFSHEDNIAMKSFWVPGEEYVTYNESNLYEWVEYYVKFPEQAQKIIDKAYSKIVSLPVGFGQYTLENISIALNTDVNVNNRIERVESLNKGDLYFRTATPFLYNYRYDTDFPSNWKEIYFRRVDSSLLWSDSKEVKIASLIEAARISFLLKKFELSMHYLDKLNSLLPGYGWIYYIQGRIHFEQENPEKALIAIEKAVRAGMESPELLQRFILPVIEKGTSCDGRRITDYLWQSVSNHGNEFQVKAFMHLVNELSGDINKSTGQNAKAVNAYYQAITYLPLPQCIKKVAPLLICSFEYERLLEISQKGTDDSPYDTSLVLYKTYGYLELNQKKNAVKALKEHRKALKSFVGIRKIFFMRYYFSILILMVPWNKSIGQKLILKAVDILNK